MQNLNKFTKHELINKIKKLDNQNSNQSSNKSFLFKIIDYILLFKSLILKLTLITFLIRWIKKYSLVKKFFHLFSLIASTLLGLSMIDIYSLDVINWIKDTSIYKWYSELLYPKEVITQVKENKSSEFQFPKRITDKTTENETTNTRISEWINRNPKREIEETKDDSIWDQFNNNTKIIIIISGVIIISGLSWYYFDNIKDGYFSSIEWIKNYFSRPPTNPSDGSSESVPTSSSQISGKISKLIEKEYDKFGKLIKTTETIDDEIELIDNSSKSELDHYLPEQSNIDIKGKSVLTSPSLDDLNNKAQDSWGESISPKSDDSSSTITPETLAKATEEFISKSWTMPLSVDTKRSINFIEKTFNSNKELDRNTTDKLLNSIIDIIISYDKQVNLYNTNEWNYQDKLTMKQGLFEFRKWIKTYHAMIIPSDNLIDIGSINDQPKLLSNIILKK